MNRKISVGMTVTIVILAMTVTFSITMLMAMRLFDHTVTSVKEKESMYNKVAEVDRYVRANDYYDIDETVLYDRLTAGYLLGTGDKYARYYTASAYTDLLNAQSGKLMGIGVELAYALRAGSRENKELGWTCFVTHVTANISEPALYGIFLRDRKALAWDMLGAVAGGVTMGLLGGKVSLNRIRTTAPPTPEFINETRKCVETEKNEDRKRRVAGNNDEKHCADNDHPERNRADDGIALPREERRIAHHGQTSVKRHNRSDGALMRQKPIGQTIFNREPHKAADQGRGCRGREPLEVILAHHAHIAVEAGQAQKCAERINEGDCPADFAHFHECEFIDDERRSDAEAHGIGETVHLNAKFALRMRKTSDTAVHAVKEH